MSEEIKEIFYKLRSDDYYEEHYQQSVYYERDLKKLENYITNLQKENEKLKEGIDTLNIQIGTYKYICENNKKTKEDYKQKIEKAIDELFELKNMIYKPETREENFEIQRKISSIIKKLGLSGDE